MNQTLSVILVIVLAVVAANAPFMTQRVLGVWAQGERKKPWVHLLELLLLYFLVGAVGLALETRLGQIAAQGWEFYAATVALFLTLAFPGFVYRYLLKHKA